MVELVYLGPKLPHSNKMVQPQVKARLCIHTQVGRQREAGQQLRHSRSHGVRVRWRPDF